MGQTPAQQVQVGAGIATAGATAAIAATHATILGMTAATAIPVIGAAIAGVSLLASYLIANSGCGITCVETSQWANQAEPLLQQNILAYFAQSSPRSTIQQAAALETFDKIWSTLVQACSQPGTGDAGKRCISDRQSGACIWKQRGDSPLIAIPGEPQAGACWNWFSGYRDPIANDVAVTSSVSGTVESLVSSVTGSTGIPAWMLLVAALAIAAVAL